MDLKTMTEIEVCMILEHRLTRSAKHVKALVENLREDGRPSYDQQKSNIHKCLLDVRSAYKALTGEAL